MKRGVQLSTPIEQGIKSILLQSSPEGVLQALQVTPSSHPTVLNESKLGMMFPFLRVVQSDNCTSRKVSISKLLSPI